MNNYLKEQKQKKPHLRLFQLRNDWCRFYDYQNKNHRNEKVFTMYTHI